jgi:pyruvate kinase
LPALLDAGVDVIRLNLAHGSHEVYSDIIARARKAVKERGRFVAVLTDLAGPKIRLAKVRQEPLTIDPGQELVFHRSPGKGESVFDLATNYPAIVDDCRPGDPILLGDGMVRLEVKEKRSDCLIVSAVTPGVLTSRMGINLPKTVLTAPTITEKDWHDLDWALEQDVDYVGISFVRSADDVRVVKQRIEERKSQAQVVAKIEKPEAVEDIDAIISAADAIMVARGDLGVELDVAEVPIIQKDLIRRAGRAGLPVIIATQMLQSMIANPQPTRAEVSDIAGAILDGADAVMLSGETAIGKYPLAAVKMMDHIIDLTEDYAESLPESAAPAERFGATEAAIARGARRIAADLDAKLIVALTHSGATALALSKQRLRTPILAVSDREDTCRRMMLYRGVRPVYHPRLIGEAELLAAVEEIASREKLVAAGDTVVIISGQFPGKPGGTDMLRVHRISDRP